MNEWMNVGLVCGIKPEALWVCHKLIMKGRFCTLIWFSTQVYPIRAKRLWEVFQLLHDEHQSEQSDLLFQRARQWTSEEQEWKRFRACGDLSSHHSATKQLNFYNLIALNQANDFEFAWLFLGEMFPESTTELRVRSPAAARTRN